MVPDFVLLFEVKIIRSRGQSVVLAGGSIRRSTPPPLYDLAERDRAMNTNPHSLGSS